MTYDQSLMATSPIANLSDDDLYHLVDLLEHLDYRKTEALNRYIAYVSELSYRRGFLQSQLIVGSIRAKGGIEESDLVHRLTDYRYERPLFESPDGWKFIGSGEVSKKPDAEARLEAERCDLNWCEMKWELERRREDRTE